MKKYTLYIVLLLCLTATSCNKWLDISPVDEVAKEQMYGNTKGFYNVLNGIYLDMGARELYGENLSWGAMEAWGRAYVLKSTVKSHESFLSLVNMSYDDRGIKGIGNTIWLGAYKNIARANEFIQSCDEKGDDFFDYGKIEKDVLKGEAMAIRAYLHFDLLRIFAQSPAYADGMAQAYIPYVKVYPSKVNPPVATSKVLEQINADLEMAASLVGEYDNYETNASAIFSSTDRFSVNFKPDWGKFYSQRGSRLNYYAIRLLQARVALYEGNTTKAAEYATELCNLIKEKKINMASPSSIKGSPKLMEEVLFGFYNTKLVTTAADWFNYSMSQVLKTDDVNNFNKITQDKRKDLLENGIITRYREDVNSSYPNYIPAIRLSEAYYILAECMALTNLKEAITLFNGFIKTNRGITSAASQIPSTVTLEEFYNYLINDARKEFVGDGQMVFFYKRLNRPVRSSLGDDKATVGKLLLPVPTGESAI